MTECQTHIVRSPKQSGVRAAKLAALIVSLASGCRYDALVETYNDAPVADAKLIVDGRAMEQARDGSIAALRFPYAGEPILVTLDGSGSHDPDGVIREYRWLSGTRISDAGAPRPWMRDAGDPEPFWRWTPPEEEPRWPAPVAAPQVRLGEGTWAFTLWVRDDHGAWSSPDTIRFVIGNAGSAGGAGDAGAVSPLGGGLDAGR